MDNFCNKILKYKLDFTDVARVIIDFSLPLYRGKSSLVKEMGRRAIEEDFTNEPAKSRFRWYSAKNIKATTAVLSLNINITNNLLSPC